MSERRQLDRSGPKSLPGPAGSAIDAGRALRPLVKAAQLGFTGGYVGRLNRLLAGDLREGPHDFLIELGCGDAPLLRRLRPRRYVGLDLNASSLAAAERRHGGPGIELSRADITEVDYGRWAGADAVVCSAVFHHLSDDQVSALAERVASQLPGVRMVCTDGVMRGPLRGLLLRLDEGDPSREPEELFALLSGPFSVRPTWSFDVPFRTVHEFGFVLEPRA